MGYLWSTQEIIENCKKEYVASTDHNHSSMQVLINNKNKTNWSCSALWLAHLLQGSFVLSSFCLTQTSKVVIGFIDGELKSHKSNMLSSSYM